MQTSCKIQLRTNKWPASGVFHLLSVVQVFSCPEYQGPVLQCHFQLSFSHSHFISSAGNSCRAWRHRQREETWTHSLLGSSPYSKCGCSLSCLPGLVLSPLGTTPWLEAQSVPSTHQSPDLHPFLLPSHSTWLLKLPTLGTAPRPKAPEVR